MHHRYCNHDNEEKTKLYNALYFQGVAFLEVLVRLEVINKYTSGGFYPDRE
jgi:hypothetical protein